MNRSIKSLSALAMCAMAMTFSSCGSDDDNVTDKISAITCNPESMYQVATLQSLMTGNYDGFITVDELCRCGDIGLGTFNRLDGEMIVLDGTVYQARYDGSVRLADKTLGVPFATVTRFDADFTESIAPVENMKQLAQQLTAIVESNGKNLIYAVRIEVNDCESILVRSVLPQDTPNRPLAAALVTDQREFTYRNVSGTVVAVYFPSFFTSQNMPGWHCHFISADRTKGGHVLNLKTSKDSQAQFDATLYFNMYMPAADSFAKGNLDKDLRDEIEKVEACE